MTSVTFVVDGQPVGKGRPRFTRTGHVYTPPLTSQYEMLARIAYQAAASMAGVEMIDGAVVVDVLARCKIPAKAGKAVRAEMLAGKIQPLGKPDVDNIGKIILDALNGVAWADDAAVIDLRVRKVYSEEPGVEVTVSEWLPAA